jgi:DNA repair exonuclease SbcCD nuclease subunit
MSCFGLMADLHLHAWSAFSTTLPDGMNSRLDGLLTEIDRCAREVATRGGKVIVLAGDIFHVRGSVAPSVLNPTIDCLRGLHRDYGIEFIIMPGNHDLEGRHSERLGSAVTALEGKGVTVANEGVIDEGNNFILVPWVENIAALKEKLTRIADGYVPEQRAGADLILHAPIDGVIEGLPFHGLSPEWLASLGFHRVYSGHYHNHKVMAEGKVVSIGALAHHTWSDVGSRAGYLIVSLESGEFGWRKSHLPEFVDLSRLTELEPDEVPLMVDGNYVRVKVAADKMKLVEQAKKELLAMGARAVLVQAEPAAPAREGREVATIKSGASLEQSVVDFVKGMKHEREEEVAKAAIDVLAGLEVA